MSTLICGQQALEGHILMLAKVTSEKEKGTEKGSKRNCNYVTAGLVWIFQSAKTVLHCFLNSVVLLILKRFWNFSEINEPS